jgi:ribosomal protein L2
MVGPNGQFEPYRPRSNGSVTAQAAERRRIAERFIEHRKQLWTYKDMARGEVMQREMDRLRNAPIALAHLDTADRDESATRLLFQGLQQHYRECLMAGRLEVWATAAHNIVDLLSDPLTKVHKRATLPRS